ncbi:MAG: phage tail protein [Chloroflexi bacterium]|nr:phage tail protein [Chloroflexota bacterium]
MKDTRRSFIKKAGAAAAAISAAPLALGVPGLAEAETGGAEAATPARPPASSTRQFQLDLDGLAAGWLQDLDGGLPYGEVVEYQNGGETVVRKHVGGVKYEDFAIQVGPGMSPGFWQWLVDMAGGNAQRKSGEIQAADFNYRTVSTRQFRNALLKEVGFPALDAASKDAAYMAIDFAAEDIVVKPGDGTIAGRAKKQKAFLASNFRLTIDGLEEACKKVNKIDAFVIKQQIISLSEGTDRLRLLEPGKLEIPNLAITLPESAAKPLQDWFDDFVIKGNNRDEQEKRGLLEFLGADLKTVLFSLEFFNLGIFRLDPDHDGDGLVARLKAEMYCEQVRFSAPGGS